MLVVIFVVGCIFTIGVAIIIWTLIESLKPKSRVEEKTMGIIIFFSLIVFLINLKTHATPYYNDIDPFIEPCYSPISYEHSKLLIAMHLLALLSMILLYFRKLKLPPLQISVFIIFLTIGIIINCQFLYQISHHDISRIHLWNDGYDTCINLAIYPSFLTLSSIGILFSLIRSKAEINSEIKYNNKWLNTINQKLLAINNLPVISILMCIPILTVIILILVLFGQDIDSLNKVYTETATWKMSHHIHPPTVNDRHGHYLCTVAAFGSPKIVKPIGVGLRHQRPIIINRQLQIANAFEFMIEQISKDAHKVIRTNYDKYGLNLSKRINTKSMSNLTYILMKPLEWIFLIALYTFYQHPEVVIKAQYRNRTM